MFDAEDYNFHDLTDKGDELDRDYQVLKEANVLKKPGGSGGGGGSISGSLHASSQTLHSQHDIPVPATRMMSGRSNPSVNVIPGGPGSSGHNTPAGPPGHHPMSVAAAPSSGKWELFLSLMG